MVNKARVNKIALDGCWMSNSVSDIERSLLQENGYQLLFLSARAIVQAYLTRSFLLNLKQVMECFIFGLLNKCYYQLPVDGTISWEAVREQDLLFKFVVFSIISGLLAFVMTQSGQYPINIRPLRSLSMCYLACINGYGTMLKELNKLNFIYFINYYRMEKLYPVVLL